MALRAQSPPALAVDAGANRHPISPYIYGINEWSDNGLMALMHIPLVRWGGDDATSFNWQNSVKNNTGDNPWCYENYSVRPGFDASTRRICAPAPSSLGTISTDGLGAEGRRRMQFQRGEVRPAKATNPDNPDCGNGILDERSPGSVTTPTTPMSR